MFNRWIRCNWFVFVSITGVGGYSGINPDNSDEFIFMMAFGPILSMISGCLFGYILNYVGLIMKQLET